MNETTDKTSVATINVACNEPQPLDGTQEEWRPVVGYEGLYEVSSLGRIKIIRTNKLMKLYKNNKGYYIVSLSRTGVKKKFLVSRLVALAFIPNPDNKPYVDHINTIPTDNRVENLHWVTQSENLANPISRARLNEALHLAKSTPEGRERNRQAQLKCKGTPEARKQNEEAHAFQKVPVKCIETGQVFGGIAEAERTLALGRGVVQRSIDAYRRGVRRIDYKGGKRVLHFMPL